MKIFITGVSSGIGRELTKQLVEAGHEVWGISRREKLLIDLSQEVKMGKFKFSVCDISNFKQLSDLKDEMAALGFDPDIVVLNAGVFDNPDKISGNPDHIERMIRVNLEGNLKCLSLFLREMEERNSGQFIAVSSLYALMPDKNNMAYAASKAGLSMAFRSLRIRYSRTGVKFKTVHPGPIDTDQSNKGRSNEHKRKGLHVATEEQMALCIIKIIGSKRQNHYFPAYVGLAYFISFWFPDPFMDWLSRKFKR